MTDESLRATIRSWFTTPPPAAEGQVRVRTLTLIRWVAIAGQAGAILVVHFAFGFELPLFPALGVVAASLILNLIVSWSPGVGARLSDRGATVSLGYDLLQLAFLLYLTGGLGNPFALLLLAPVTISATILSWRSTVALSLLAIVCTTVLAVAHLPLPWSGAGYDLPEIYILGAWTSLNFGIVFFAAYAWRVAEEARRMSNALTATQLALSREQQLSALGGLAAAAAHELGTPLGTIALTVREIANDLPADSPLADDIRLLIDQTARCRDILAELARRPKADDGDLFSLLPFDALVEAAAAPHMNDRVRVRFVGGSDDGTGTGDVPVVHKSPEILHGLGNLIQNALQFARSEVVITTRWSPSAISVTVRDDGPGIPGRVLERLGEPYFSSRETKGDHMGLGVFIAQTLLQRTGATLDFANQPAGGASITVRWPRDAIAEAGLPADWAS